MLCYVILGQVKVFVYGGVATEFMLQFHFRCVSQPTVAQS